MCVCAPLEEVAPDTYNNLIPMFPHDFWQTHELPKPLTLKAIGLLLPSDDVST